MKIRHSIYGEVDGVRGSLDKPGYWMKKELGWSRYFHPDQGWSEVKEPRYVDVTGDIFVSMFNRLIMTKDYGDIVFPYGLRPNLKIWFDLPNNLLHEIYHLTPKGVIEHIKRYEKPCLIVEKEE